MTDREKLKAVMPEDCNGEDTKIRTPFAQIIVDGTSDKPYYNIMYFDPADGDYHIGYGSYFLSYVFEWLEEYFEIVDAPVATDNHVGGKWIPVTERLPEDMGDVLVVAFWHERWQTMIGWCRKAEAEWRVYTSHGEVKPGGVTHWMPLPEPPKEGE